MAAESGELIGACEFMKGEEQPPRLLQPPTPLGPQHFSPRSPSHYPRLPPGSPVSCSRRARSQPLSLPSLPEDPLLPASVVLASLVPRSSLGWPLRPLLGQRPLLPGSCMGQLAGILLREIL